MMNENDGIPSYSHEFFIKIAPNLLKYMNPCHRLQNGPPSASIDAIVSPPRIGRLSNGPSATNPLDDVFSGNKRKIPDNTSSNQDSTDVAEISESDPKKTRTDSQNCEKESTSSTTTLGNEMESPVTPVFTLANQVSPPNSAATPKAIVADSSSAIQSPSVQPRPRLQSNRGGSSKRSSVRALDPLNSKNVVPNNFHNDPSPVFPMIPKRGSFPVSKRGRRNVSSRGGRGGVNGGSNSRDVIPKALDIPVRYDGISAPSVLQSLPPRPN